MPSRLIHGTIEAATEAATTGDADAVETLRALLRARADACDPHQVTALTETLCEVRKALVHPDVLRSPESRLTSRNVPDHDEFLSDGEELGPA